MSKTAVLLINVGTPDSPSVKDVRRYLSEFLNDKRVIDIPWAARKLLVNGIIVPFRAPKSAKIYEKVWTDKGSPLLIHGENLARKLQELLGRDYMVELGMRYRKPSISSALQKFKAAKVRRIIVMPLFPQYAASTTGTAVEEVFRLINKEWAVPEVTTIGSFFQNESFVQNFADIGLEYHPEDYDHVLFSYHGLPVRQVNKVHPEMKCENCTCHEQYDAEAHFQCYKAECYETTRLIAKKMYLKPEEFSVAFQSRLDKNWLTPFSDKRVAELAQNGAKRILVLCPSFVADCLETTFEIGEEYAEIFHENGGEHLQLVRSLNDDDRWVETVAQLVKREN
ncbi:ferrochelatase [Prolixibacteraceae bacterium JC049]|nr:ferrochelatase [Prolixibacteraceae bacterium JC049]